MLQRFIDPAAVEAEIERVRALSGNALRRRWQSLFGRLAPEHLTTDLLRRMIVNRVQEEAFGTLDRATLKLLDGLARRHGPHRADRNLKIDSFDDPRLRTLKISVTLVGKSNPPPAQALAERGIIDNVVGFTVYGDYPSDDPAGKIVEAVAKSSIGSSRGPVGHSPWVGHSA